MSSSVIALSFSILVIKWTIAVLSHLSLGKSYPLRLILISLLSHSFPISFPFSSFPFVPCFGSVFLLKTLTLAYIHLKTQACYLDNALVEQHLLKKIT